MDAETLLTTTRTVRRKLDLDRAVPLAVIEDCLRVAQQAPASGQLLGALRWLLVQDATLRGKVAAVVRTSASAMLDQYGHLVDSRMLASARHLLDNLDRVPVLAIPCLPSRPPAGHLRQTSYYGSAYPAIWSFQLALHDRGLGSSICGYHLMDGEAEVADLLGIPGEATQITMLAVGYTTQSRFQPAARPPVVSYVDRWRQPASSV